MQYISSYELHQLILDERSSSYVIIDVRDYDFDGKLITNAVNVPFVDFSMANVEEVKSRIKKVIENRAKVIVHCALSQVRGPKSARIFQDAFPDVNFIVLRGGYDEYSTLYPQDIQ